MISIDLFRDFLKGFRNQNLTFALANVVNVWIRHLCENWDYVGPFEISGVVRIKPGAHGEDFAKQCFKNGTVLSKILTVCGQFLLGNGSFVAVTKISSMFDNFCHA